MPKIIRISELTPAQRLSEVASIIAKAVTRRRQQVKAGGLASLQRTKTTTHGRTTMSDLPPDRQAQVEKLFRCLCAKENLAVLLRKRHLPWRDVIELDDFSQKVLLTAWQRRDSFKGNTEAELAGWIDVISQRVALDEGRNAARRKRGRREMLALMFKRENISEVEVKDYLDWVMSDLSIPEQNILHLKYHEGLSPEDIAQKLKMSVAATRQAHYRAITRMAKKKSTERPETL